VNKKIILVVTILVFSACNQNTKIEHVEEEVKSEDVVEESDEVKDDEEDTNTANEIADALLDSIGSIDYTDEIIEIIEEISDIQYSLILITKEKEENWETEYSQVLTEMLNMMETIEDIDEPELYINHKEIILKSVEEYHNAYNLLLLAILQEDDKLRKEYSKSLEKARLYIAEASEIMNEITDDLEKKQTDILDK